MLSWKITVLFCGLLYYYIALISLCSCEKRLQLVVEHPTITYVNNKYVTQLVVVSRRYSRKDPKRYISVFSTTIKEIDNKYSIHFDFYELLSNVYKPSFVSLHFDNFCDLIEKDTIIGSTIVTAYLRSTPKENRLKNLKCPIPPGVYNYENFTIPYAPIYKHFPFTNGRIFINLTYDTTEKVASLFVDMTVK